MVSGDYSYKSLSNSIHTVSKDVRIDKIKDVVSQKINQLVQKLFGLSFHFLDSSRIQKDFSKLSALLNQTEELVQKEKEEVVGSATVMSVKLKNLENLSQALHHIHQKIFFSTYEKKDQYIQRLTSLENSIDQQIGEIQKSYNLKENNREGLDVVIKLDFDEADMTGIMIKDSIQVVANDVPLVMSQTLISGPKDSTGEKNVSLFLDAVKSKVKRGELEVYQNIDQGIVLFLPKNYPPMDATDRLKKLGFNEEKLKKLPCHHLEQKLLENKKPATMENLYQIFDTTGDVKKRVLLEGHGQYSNADEGGHIVGLNVDKYQNFLGFLNSIHTEYVSVISCYSGGRNTMKHLAKDSEGATQQLNFPLVLHASSDMPAELLFRNTRTFFHGVNELLNKEEPMTQKSITQLLQKQEGELKEMVKECQAFMYRLSDKIPKDETVLPKVFLNQLKKEDPEFYSLVEYYKHFVPRLKSQLEGDKPINRKSITACLDDQVFKLRALNNSALVQFPHSPELPSHFYSVNPYGDSREITYVDLEKHLLKKESYTVQETDLLQLHPAVLPLTLSIHKNSQNKKEKGILLERNDVAALMSMIPGNAHHLISKIEVKGMNLEEFLKPTLKMFQQTSFGSGLMESHKAFFINQMTLDGQTLDHVVVDLSLEERQILYVKNDSGHPVYVLKEISEEGIGKEKILSEAEWISTVYLIQAKTKESKEALKSATGGQQGEKDIASAMREVFWKENVPALALPFEAIQNNDMKTLKDCFNHLELNQKLSILGYAVQMGNTQAVKFILGALQHLSIPLISFLETALRNDQEDVALMLLQNINEVQMVTYGHGVIKAAVDADNETFLKLALEKGANIDSLDESQTPLLHHFSSRLSALKLLVKYGAQVNQLDGYGEHLMNSAIRNQDPEAVKFLLENHSDVTEGMLKLSKKFDNREIQDLLKKRLSSV